MVKMNKIYTRGSRPISGARIEVDEHIPLLFRRNYELNDTPIYVRIGNMKSQMIEFVVDPDDLSILRVVVVAMDLLKSLQDPPSGVMIPNCVPLLVVDKSEISESRTIDVNASVAFGMSAYSFTIAFEDSPVARCCRAGRLTFGLGTSGELVRITLDGLSEREGELIRQASVE